MSNFLVDRFYNLDDEVLWKVKPGALNILFLWQYVSVNKNNLTIDGAQVILASIVS